jgi:hypothetical protein
MIYQVTGTTRNPDGDTRGRIHQLIIWRNSTNEIISKDEAVRMARAGQLWSTDDYGNRVAVLAVEGIQHPDYVKTDPDKTRRNNLLSLKIWYVAQGRWITPQAA